MEERPRLDKQIQLAIYLMKNRINREHNLSLTSKDLFDCLNDVFWDEYKSENLCVLVHQIFSLKYTDVVDYLAQKAIIDSQNSDLDSFEELL